MLPSRLADRGIVAGRSKAAHDPAHEEAALCLPVLVRLGLVVELLDSRADSGQNRALGGTDAWNQPLQLQRRANTSLERMSRGGGRIDDWNARER